MKTNRHIRILISRVCLAAALLAGGAYADPITGSGVWQDFPLTLESDGYPFLDTPSLDGPNGNLAYYLSGYGGAYLLRTPRVTPQWYGYGSGGAVADYYFNSSYSLLTATLLLENSAWAQLNEFGWYDASSPTVLHTLFRGADAAGASITFTPSAQYGYYLTNGMGLTYYTQSSLNPVGDTEDQHFAALRASNLESDRMWIGAEDLPLLYAADEMGGDRNDMVVRVLGTPEPATGLLAGGSLLALAWGLRWARSRR
jgi:hypothetical protein